MGAFEIMIRKRTKKKADNIKDIFNNIKLIDWGEIPDFDVIINATSLGLNKDDKIN